MKKIDKEILTQKFSNFYYDNNAEDGEKQFELYDIQELYYPYLHIKVDYQFTQSKEIHQIELKILEMIEILSSTKYDNLLGELRTLTQLDKDIFDSIISNLQLKGYIDINPLCLTSTGKEAKRTQKANINNSDNIYAYIDSILGEIQLDVRYDKLPKDALELKPKLPFDPRTETLNEQFIDNKTLRTCLIETLRYKEKGIWDITEVMRVKKVFKKFICLFFCKDNEEKILIVDSQYEKDIDSTEKFEKILAEKKLDFLNTETKNESENTITQHRENKKRTKDILSFEDGKDILLYHFPKYLEYALKYATEAVYIASPWVRIKALRRYQKFIEEALQKNIKVYIRYGLQKTNKKRDIDEESEKVFEEFKQKYPHYFHVCRGNSHAKVLIFDDKWVIKGSFNWFSCAADENDSQTGEEEGLLTNNTKTIQESKENFTKQNNKTTKKHL